MSAVNPVARDGEFVYAVVDHADLPALLPHVEAMITEDEGETIIVERSVADKLGLAYDFVAAWITLTLDTSLEAIGLTAAFSAALGEAGISCNVLAGAHHDHILVPSDRRDEALQILERLHFPIES